MIKDIDSIIENLINTKQVVSVFTDINDRAKCSVGFIERYDNLAILIKHLDSHGESDGYAWRKKENIYRIDINGIYEKKLEKLYNLKNEKHNEIIQQVADNDILVDIINNSIINNKILEISLDEYNEQELIIGIAKKINNNEYLVIDKINDIGEINGITVVNLDDIVNLNFDSKDGRDIMLLHISYI